MKLANFDFISVTQHTHHANESECDSRATQTKQTKTSPFPMFTMTGDSIVNELVDSFKSNAEFYWLLNAKETGRWSAVGTTQLVGLCVCLVLTIVCSVSTAHMARGAHIVFCYIICRVVLCDLCVLLLILHLSMGSATWLLFLKWILQSTTDH